PEIRNVNQMTRVIHGITVTFQDLKPNADAWQLRMHVSQPNLGGPDWQQLMDGVQNRMQILDAEGTPLDHRGASTSSNNGAIDITLDFGRSNRPDGRQSGEPARLVWEVPTRTRELTVSISFKDLPLFDQN
ncbi:MAG TPA: hypothetical protein VLJ39_11380, partial [Tepidisphaeraceae bacterium]|nr:hypothetical protein [Tepidisphaeraceae bacterium]